MLKRKATQYIENWVKTRDKKCLVVQGARQVGEDGIITLPLYMSAFIFRLRSDGLGI